MKLNKYIRKMLDETWPSAGIPTEEDIEEWIGDWYKDIYDRQPPMWLVGKRWYDRRMEKANEDSTDR